MGRILPSFALALAGAVSIAACGDISVESNCTAGDLRACLCETGGAGTQTCLQNSAGVGFGPCVCNGPVDVKEDGVAPDVSAPDVTDPPDAASEVTDPPDVTPDPGPGEDTSSPCGGAGAACDDEDPCTTGDVCTEDGECVGVPVDCDDGIACTANLCSPTTGACLIDTTNCSCPPGEACDDGNPCTEGDTCKGDGETCAGAPKDCDDGNACTVDGCASATGACLHDDSQCSCTKAGDCDDGNPCTADSCVDGTCLNTPNTAATCSDGDPCTTDDACLSDGSCKGTPKVCDDDVACSLDTCDATTGQCLFDTSSCACLADEDCNDGNPCTADTCVDGGCAHDPQAGSCDDGNPCTLDDVCDAGVCTSGTAKDCADDLDCSLDSCDLQTGECVNLTSGCECLADADCPQATACTSWTCALPAGECVPTHAEGEACDDGQPCTDGDLCDAGGTCAGSPVVCDDGKACSQGDACDETTGECVFDTSSCACAQDADCGPNTQCVTKTCDVSEGTCLSTVLADQPCSDGNACTLDDTCTALGACVGTPKSCADGIECTVEQCVTSSGQCVIDGGKCECKIDADCDDKNPCTLDTCDAQRTCKHTPLTGLTCNDNSACTLDDVCTSAGTCKGSPMKCDDGNPCTKDYCEAGTCKADLDDSCPKRYVFVTSLAIPGSFTGGFFTKADDLCNDEKHVKDGGQRPTTGTYKALVSQNKGLDPKSSRIATTTPNCDPKCTDRMNWVLAPNTLYVQADGDFILQTDGNAIFRYSNCGKPSCNSARGWIDSPKLAWTGLKSGWTPASDCDAWTQSSSSVKGAISSPSATDSTAIFKDTFTCNEKFHLICIEQ